MKQNYETLEQANYEFVKKTGKEYIMLDKDTNKQEVFFHNQNHASWGLIYEGKHLEFARSLTDTPDPATKEQSPTPVLEGKEGFTGGNWIADKKAHELEVAGDIFWTCDIMSGKEKIAMAYGDTKEEAEANARLIAESKNMFYALQVLADIYDELTDTRKRQGGELFGYNGAKLTVAQCQEAKEIINRIANK